MHFSTLTSSSIALAAASGAYAAAKGGYSSSSVSMSDAVGSSVASSIGSSLGSTGWSWGIGNGADGSRVHGEQPAQSWLANNINLFNNKISSNPDNVILTKDPAGSGQVLSVKYGANSYGLHTNPSGGTSFYSQPFLGSGGARDASANPFVSATKSNSGQGASRNELLLSYSVYFPEDFDFVKGGKLPGLYSSIGEMNGNTLKATTSGCEGGSEGDIGSKCWSMRVMWRTDGQAEIYAYIPTEVNNLNYKLCPADQTDSKGAKLICNSDYGTSIGRGNFKFEKGKWNDIALHVKLNSESKADGLVELYHNGQKGIGLNNIVIRTDGQSSNSRRSLDAPTRLNSLHKRGGNSNNWVDKIMFTTFFGGSGSQWATPHATQTYYKNFALFAGSGSSGNSGSSSSSSSSSSSTSSASHSALHSHSSSSSSSKPTSSWHSSSGSASGSGSDSSDSGSSGSGSGSDGSGTDSSGSSSSSSASAAPTSSSGHHHHHSNTHHHHASKSQQSDIGQSNSSSASSSWVQPSATSSQQPKQCRKKNKNNSSSGQQRRAERDAMVQVRTDAQQKAAQHKRFRHHRGPNYMRPRQGVWA